MKDIIKKFELNAEASSIMEYISREISMDLDEWIVMKKLEAHEILYIELMDDMYGL